MGQTWRIYETTIKQQISSIYNDNYHYTEFAICHHQRKNWKMRGNPYNLRLHFDSRLEVHELFHWRAGLHCGLLPHVICIFFLMRGGSSQSSSTISYLKCSRLEGPSRWGKFGRKLTSASQGLSMLECEGSLSGLLLRFFPAFTVTY